MTRKVPLALDRTRLDLFILDSIPDLSRSYASKLCIEGKVTVNGKPQLAGYKIKAGDSVKIDYDPTRLNQVPKIDVPIIYEDDDCLVINKPAGLITHNRGKYWDEPSVASFIRDRLRDMEGMRGGIVHRLDRNTSGVLICAKNSVALAALQKQFATRKTKKTYVAVVKGQPKTPAAIIDAPIERNPKLPSTFRVGANGKKAITTYKTLQIGNNHSLLELTPKTGRTHQLRVHLSSLGNPILGDVIYGGEPADRLYLHALSLTLGLPSGEQKTFKAPLPGAFSKQVT